MPSRRCRSVAESQCERPNSFFVTFVKCGAKITQPVWPVQCSTYNPASFSGRKGSPALPNTHSMKSKLLTKLPGAKKRISIDFSEINPSTSGQTTGRNKSETKHSACSVCVEVNG